MSKFGIIFNIGLVIFLSVVNIHASTTMEEKRRLLEKLDQLDALDFMDTIDEVNKCTKQRRFACSEQKLKEAKKLARTQRDKRELSFARMNLEDEREEVREEERIERRRLARLERQREERRQRAREEERRRAEAEEERWESQNQEAQTSDWAVAALGALDSMSRDLAEQNRQSQAELNRMIRETQQRQREKERRERARREAERERREASQRTQYQRDQERREQAREARERERREQARQTRVRKQKEQVRRDKERRERERQDRINEARQREYAMAEARKKKKEPCVGRYESTGPAPKGRCRYVYSDYNRVIRLGEEASKTILLESTEDGAKQALKYAIKKNLERQCKSSGYEFVVHEDSLEHYDIEFKATACRKVKAGFDSGYLCKGNGSAICGRYGGNDK